MLDIQQNKIRRQICNVPVDALTMQQTLEIIQEAITEKRFIHHVVINAAKVVHAQKDEELKKAIVDCDIINADGKAIVWASRILNRSVPERVAGIDLMINLVELAGEKGFKIFLLGAEEEIVKRVANIYQKKYGNNIIVGYRNGYFREEEEVEIANQIAVSQVDMLFVAITSPKKEKFLNRYKAVMKVPFIMGVGGSFDVIAGKTKRAPIWMQNAGLEWFFRVLQEPGRMWKRYLLGNSAFIYLVFKEKIRLLFNFKNLKPIR